VVDGFPGRVDQCSALGNAVVPQIPQLIGHAILETEAAA
jgi:site-specific DNA-cytosine methylase